MSADTDAPFGSHLGGDDTLVLWARPSVQPRTVALTVEQTHHSTESNERAVGAPMTRDVLRARCLREQYGCCRGQRMQMRIEVQ